MYAKPREKKIGNRDARYEYVLKKSLHWHHTKQSANLF